MPVVSTTAIASLYKEHIRLVKEKQVDALLDQYTTDAVLISSFSEDRQPKYYRGHQEIRRHFQGILGLEGLSVEISFWAETERPDTLMVVEIVRVVVNGSEQTMRFADSWVIKDGKISIHFAGMVQYPNGSLA